MAIKTTAGNKIIILTFLEIPCLLLWFSLFAISVNWMYFFLLTAHLIVVYFDQLLGASRTRKLIKTLFQPFSTFFVRLKPFSVISPLKSLKNIWKWAKKVCFSIFSTPQSWSTCKSWLTPWRGYLEIIFFWLICVLTSFQVRTAPKIWLKYRTPKNSIFSYFLTWYISYFSKSNSAENAARAPKERTTA